MAILLLIRHGENEFTKSGKLAGHTPGVHLNEKGQQQAQALGEALKGIPITTIYSSPLERALETAAPIAAAHNLTVIQEPDLIESFIGKWQGRSWKALSLTKAWKIVQHAPSRFRFPEGESFPEMQTRIVSALERILQSHKKPNGIIACVFHADPIKLAISHFLGLPLDHFQRLGCDTGSVSVLNVGEMGAGLIKLNQRLPFDFPTPPRKK
jgi:probable phosphomutase (TIGR03848 family)